MIQFVRHTHAFPPWRALLGCVLVVLGAALTASSCGGEHGAAPSTDTWPASPRVETIREQLHGAGSGAQARALFPDLTLTYVDDGHGKKYPTQILPFRYYWSPSARVTIAICSIERTVFVCPYKVDGLLSTGDFPKCEVADIYKSDEPAPPVGR